MGQSTLVFKGGGGGLKWPFYDILILATVIPKSWTYYSAQTPRDYIIYSIFINMPSRSTNLLYNTKEKYTQEQNIFLLNHKFNTENLT